jgi:hypothetical protein
MKITYSNQMHGGLDLEALIDCIIGLRTTIQSIAHVAKKETLEKHVNNMFSWIHNEIINIIFMHKKNHNITKM